MNFLAHLLLTYPHRELTMGNLLGDMIRRSQTTEMPAGLNLGIRLHQEIDSYTDSHPDIRALIDVMRARHGRYAPVTVDILLDHVLVRQWDFHADLPYPAFTQWVYALIPSYIPHIPTQIAQRLQGMVHHRWIDDYGTITKLRDVLIRMDHRASFPSQFLLAMQDIEEHYDMFDATFREFYPELKEVVNKSIDNLEKGVQAVSR